MSRGSVRKQGRVVAGSGQRDEAVRVFAAALAHQLGNLLQVVNGNLELIAQQSTDETVQRYLANARVATDQLTELARNLPVDPPE